MFKVKWPIIKGARTVCKPRLVWVQSLFSQLLSQTVDLRTKSNSVHRKLVLLEAPRDRRILQGQGPAPLLTEGSV